MNQDNNNHWQIIALTILRVFIGWHFLYEGLIKLFDPAWSAAAFLSGSQGPMANIFNAMATNTVILETVNLLNQWALIIIGLSLFIGLYSRWASLGGIFLLLLYYLVNPPFIGLDIATNEGSYLIINKNLIEMAILFVLYLFKTEKVYGIERLFVHKE